MGGLPGTVSARAAWRTAGYRDGLKGWPRRTDVPSDHAAAYLAGWVQGNERRRENGK